MQESQEPGPQSVPNSAQDGHWWEGGKKTQSTEEFSARKLDTQLD